MLNLLKKMEHKVNINDDYICLWFPYLPVEISFRHHAEFQKIAFAITSQKKNKQTLCSVNPIGELSGLKLGMHLSEAHILCKNLVTEQYNPQKKVSFILKQAKWCSQFTPRISVEKEDRLILNLKGCIHLFGSTNSIIKKMYNHFKKINISASFSSGENITSTKALVQFSSKKILTKRFPLYEVHFFPY